MIDDDVRELKEDMKFLAAVLAEHRGDEELTLLGQMAFAKMRAYWGERVWILALKQIVESEGEHLLLNPMEEALIATPS
jgi:hypothetical protein